MTSPVAKAPRCWAITCYFNPVGYESRLANYKTFRESLGIPLLTVEWSVDGRFDLSESDAEILVQTSSPDLMWQKERLLNIGLRALPDSVELVAWLDCDVIFTRSDWWTAATRELETSSVVQLFSRCIFPGPNARTEGDQTAVGVDSAESLVHLSRQPRTEAALFAQLWGSPTGHSPKLWGSPTGHSPKLWGSPTERSPKRRRLAGFAWAGRRELLERHGFYDACVFGAGDRAFVCSAFGEQRRAKQAWLRTPQQERHYFEWADPFAIDVAGRIGLVEGDLVHLWHGKLENRQHRVRHLPAERHEFDPARDIRIDPVTGLWRWASSKVALHHSLAEFFDKRREDTASE